MGITTSSPVQEAHPRTRLPPGMPVPKEVQAWTLTGYPIVDGKYLDSGGVIRQVLPGEQETGGPPTIDLLWQNLAGNNHFWTRKGFNGTTTQCLSKVVEVLQRAGDIEVVSLNVSRYSVVLITQTTVKRDDVIKMMQEVGL